MNSKIEALSVVDTDITKSRNSNFDSKSVNTEQFVLKADPAGQMNTVSVDTMKDLGVGTVQNDRFNGLLLLPDDAFPAANILAVRNGILYRFIVSGSHEYGFEAVYSDEVHGSESFNLGPYDKTMTRFSYNSWSKFDTDDESTSYLKAFREFDFDSLVAAKPKQGWLSGIVRAIK